MAESKRVKMTGLWKNETRNGKEYWSGNLGSARIEVWPNDRKERDNHPDLNVYLAPRERKENQGGAGQQEGGGQRYQDRDTGSDW